MKHKLNVSNHVRISKVKPHCEKGYLPNWSDEIFTTDEHGCDLGDRMSKSQGGHSGMF